VLGSDGALTPEDEPMHRSLSALVVLLLGAAPTWGQPPESPLPPGAVGRLGSPDLRHTDVVTFVAFLPDNKTVLSVGLDGMARLWDAPAGTARASFRVSPAFDPTKLRFTTFQGYNYLAVALAPDGKTLATAARDKVVRLWDVATGKEMAALPANVGAVSLAWSPDGATFAAVMPAGVVRQWDWPGRKQLRDLGELGKEEWAASCNGHGCLAFDSEGKQLVVGLCWLGLDRQYHYYLRRWSVAGGDTKILSPDAREPWAAPVHAGGQQWIVGSSEGRLLAVDAGTGKTAWSVQTGDGGLCAAALAPDGKTLYTRSLGEAVIRVRDPQTGKERATFGAPAGAPRLLGAGMGHPCLAVSPDGKLLATGGDGHAVRILDTATGKQLGPAGPHLHPVHTLQFAPDSKHLLTWGADRAVCLWDVPGRKEVRRWTASAPGQALAISRDGATMAAADANGRVTITDAATAKQLAAIDGTGRLAVTTVTFAPDGKTLAVWLDGEERVRLYDLPGGTFRCLLPRPVHGDFGREGEQIGGSLGFVLFSGDGSLVAAGGGREWVVVCETATGKLVMEFKLKGVFRLHGGAFGPDNRTLALDLGDGHVDVWEVATGSQRCRFGAAEEDRPLVFDYRSPLWGQHPTAYPAMPQELAFSPDGGLLARSTGGGEVQLFSTLTWKPAGKLAGTGGWPAALAFAPDGKVLAVAAADTTVVLYAVPGHEANLSLEWDQKRGDEAWQLLAGRDAAKALAAMQTLAASPKEAVSLLKQHLKPVPPVDAAAVAKLIEQLDDPQFKVRQQSGSDLAKFGEPAAAGMRKALTGKVSLEMRQRLESILDKVVPPLDAPELLRALRAIESLERIGTPEAVELLRALAGGAPGVRLTEAARAALSRVALARRKG
jgi:WD40 repeat protein